MLSLVEECLELIVDNGKAPVDLSRIDFDDPEVYDMICAGDTIGVFQIESRAQIQMLPRTRPRTLEDLAVAGRDRPAGPDRRRRGQPVRRAPRERMRHQLRLRAARTTTRCWSRCWPRRSASSSTRSRCSRWRWRWPASRPARRSVAPRDEPQALARGDGARSGPQFRDGAPAKGVPSEIARRRLREAARLRRVSASRRAMRPPSPCWPTSRAGCSYYYPAEFICALLNNQPMGFYPPHVLINDAKRHGVRMLAPDINASGVRCAVEDRNGIRIGLAYVKTLSGDAARRIVLEREANGPYRSLADFIRRCPIGPDAVENLIAVGAFDRFGLGRREALWQVGLFIPSKRFGIGKKRAAGERGRQLSLALPVEQDMVSLQADGRVGADGGGLRGARPLRPLSPAGVAAEPAAGALRVHGRYRDIAQRTGNPDRRADRLPAATGHGQGRPVPVAGGRGWLGQCGGPARGSTRSGG